MELEKHQAIANGRNLDVSTKESIELCNFIKRKQVAKAKSLLEAVTRLKVPVPYQRFKRDIPHQKGIGSGRYPEKAANAFLRLLTLAEFNAKEKGLDVQKLFVRYAIANKGPKSYHAGRMRGLRKKRTHLSIVLEEKQAKEVKKATS